MEYQVSEKVQMLFNKVTSLPAVQKAFDYIREDEAYSLEEQIELTLIEAPTFHEVARAAAFCEKLKALGLDDAYVDEFGNAIGRWKGTGDGPTVLLEAHLDTVFPFGSVKEVRREGGRLHAPGIVDDTRGLAIVLAALRGLKASGLQTRGDILFVGTSREEGMGSLGGMKDLLNAHPEIEASISVDGPDPEYITYRATGFKTCEINFYGIGGHAYGAFGQMANPLHAAARFVAKVADFQVPAEPKTTFCVSNFHAGNDAGIHAIVPKATVKINYRSNSPTELEKLHKMVFDAVQSACDEETARWGKDTITWDSVTYCDVPAGDQDLHAPLVESTYLAAKLVSEDPGKVKFAASGCVNGNIAVAKGLPCVTVGDGPKECNVHNLAESFDPEGCWRLPQEVFLLTLLAAGIDGETDSVIG
jgi:acetylornithine deacetylase/succinyl-diaminopimelate desuccinylase-like protein